MFRHAIAMCVMWMIATVTWAQTPVTPTLDAEHAEDRVGKSYWARPGLNDSSVDFYEDVALRERAPVYRKTRFRISDIVVDGEGGSAQIIFRVRIDGVGDRFIALASFDKALYRELAPNQVMSAPPNSPVGAAPHVWIFERSSIFASDPDVIWARIKNEGPRTFKPFKGPDERRKSQQESRRRPGN